MFFDDKPAIQPGTWARGEHTGLDALFSTAAESMERTDSQNARWRMLNEELDARNKLIFEATGVKKENPLYGITKPEDRAEMMRDVEERAKAAGVWGQFDPANSSQQFAWAYRLKRYERELAELVEKYPHAAQIIGADVPPSMLVAERAQQAEAAAGDARERRGMKEGLINIPRNMWNDPLGMAAMLAGGIWGQRYSPADVLVMLGSGFAGSARKSLLHNAALNAVANAGGQALLEPGVQGNRAAMGLDYGIAQSAENVASAALMGGALDFVVRGGVRGVRAAGGAQDLGGVFRDAPERIPDIRTTPDAAPPPVPPPSPELIEGIRNNDPAAIREAIKTYGADADPTVRGALYSEEADAITQRHLDEVYGAGAVDSGEAYSSLLRSIQALEDPDAPPQVRPIEAIPEARSVLDDPNPRELGSNQHGDKFSVDGKEVVRREVDLKTLPLEREIAALRAEAQLSRDMLGRVMLYERLDGSVMVLDGNKRVGLAQASPETDVKVPAIVLKESAGWTEGEARAMAARENIKLGDRRDPIDIARQIRETPGLIDRSVEITAPVAIARALAKLSDDAFEMVRRGDASPMNGVAVADHVADPGQHAAMLRQLQALGPEDVASARAGLAALLPPDDMAVNDALMGVRRTDADREKPLDGGSKIDDPMGAEAKKQTQILEQSLSREIADAKARPERIAKAIDKTTTAIEKLAKAVREAEDPTKVDKAQAELRDKMQEKAALEADSSRRLAKEAERASKVEQAIERLAGIVPEGVAVKTFTRVADLPAGVAEAVIAENQKAMAEAVVGIARARTQQEQAMWRARFDQAQREQIVEGMSLADTIWIATYAAEPEARIAHEVVHALKNKNLLQTDEVGLLATRARELGVWRDEAATDYLALFNDRAARSGLDGPARVEYMRQMMDEEAAAHLIDAHMRGMDVSEPAARTLLERIAEALRRLREFFRAQNLRTADDVIEAILSGQAAKRELVRRAEVPMEAVDGPHRYQTESEIKYAISDVERRARLDDLAQGKPARVQAWHGGEWSPSDAPRITNAERNNGKGAIWFSPDRGEAASYAKTASAGNIIEAELDIAKPFVWDLTDVEGTKRKAGEIDPATGQSRIDSWHDTSDSFMAGLKANGYDALVQLNTKGEVAEIAVLDAAKIRPLSPSEMDLPPSYLSRPHLMFAISDASTGRDMRRALDSLGFYSKALEAAKSLKQAKGTPEQMLAQLKSAGVKDAEIEATNLKTFLDGKKAVTRDEIISHLEENRVGLRENLYQGQTRIPTMDSAGNITIHEPAKWSSYSLDPSNPTYRETVLHLPQVREASRIEMDRLKARLEESGVPAEERRQLWKRQKELEADIRSADDFVAGHFPEPNIIGHMMHSMVKDASGKDVFLIDQIQSDWGQKIESDTRNALAKRLFGKRFKDLSPDERKQVSAAKQEGDKPAGVRDEAKIAELEKRIRDVGVDDEVMPYFNGNRNMDSVRHHMQRALEYYATHPNEPVPQEFKRALDVASRAPDDVLMWIVELSVAETATPGNPLVNTTDQWVNTTLRRAIRIAAEADANSIAIPSGDTVLSYNPGDTEGMRGFYDGIVPKNLRNLLSKIDKETPAPQKVDNLVTPSKGPAGSGFTVFPLTDKVKQAVLTEGQPMFAFAGERARTADLDALAQAKQMMEDGKSREDIWTETGWMRWTDGKWHTSQEAVGSRPPWLDYDVPEDQQIVRFADGSQPMFAMGDRSKEEGPRPEPGARGPKAEAMGASSVLAETPQYKRAEAAAVKAFSTYEFRDGSNPEAATSLNDISFKEPQPAAAAIEALARSYGHDLTMRGGGEGVSQYGTLRLTAPSPDGDVSIDIKIRVSDHGRQSSLHDGAHLNLTPDSTWTTAELAEFFATVRAIPVELENSLGRYWDGTAEAVVRGRRMTVDETGTVQWSDANLMFAISDRPRQEAPDYTPLARRIVQAAQPLLDRQFNAGPLAFNLAQSADGSIQGKIDAPQAGLTISRDADGLVASVEYQGQTYRIDRDNMGAIIGLTSGREIEIGDAITTMIAQAAEQNGISLEADAIRPIVAQTFEAIRAAQDPEAATLMVREALQTAVRQLTPEPETIKAANDNFDVETPLVRDLQEVQFYEELAMLIGACKA